MTTRANTPGFRRTANPPPLRLTERDIQILVQLHHYGLMSSHHIEILLFPTSIPGKRTRKNACQRRLQKIFHHGLVQRLIRPLVPGDGRTPYLYTLDKLGGDIVARRLGIERREVRQVASSGSSYLFLEHTLLTVDLQVQFRLLEKAGYWKIVNWLDDVRMKGLAAQNLTPTVRLDSNRQKRIIPDSYFAIDHPKLSAPSHCFLEVDRGTMTLAAWREKIDGYRHFRSSGASMSMYGTSKFRVIVVTTSRRRLENLIEETGNAGGDHRFWFTTSDHLDIWQPDSLCEPIWERLGKDGFARIFPR